LMGLLENVGPGPIERLSVWFTPNAVPRREFPAFPLSAGSRRELILQYDVDVSSAGAANVNRSWPFRCAFNYFDIFGNEGWIAIASHSGLDRRPRGVGEQGRLGKVKADLYAASSSPRAVGGSKGVGVALRSPERELRCAVGPADPKPFYA
jgi:hypothetical protein